jgi:hypothetical protein
MGSGGGSRSSGITFSKPRPSKQPKGSSGGGGSGAGGGGGGGGEGGSCDLNFEVDLAGVNGSIAGSLEIGAELNVAIVQQNNFPTVVCRTSVQEVVGSLANVEDLAELIACMQAGHTYAATVRDVGPTYCSVFIEHQ